MAVSDGSRTIAPSAIVGDATLYQADCRDVLRGLADNSIDSVVTDPPYALVSIQKRFGKPGSAPVKVADVNASNDLKAAYARASAGFMGKTWDTGEVAFSEEFWAEVLRVLKPGGHVVAFSGTRTYHRMAVAIEDAGFEIRDRIRFDQSFDTKFGPLLESLNDEQRGALLELLNDYGDGGSELAWAYGSGFPKSHNQPGGLGTALKPAWEPICLARKPLIGTVAENVLEHGTGALNIDGCRVGTEERTYEPKGTSTNAAMIRVPEHRDGNAGDAVTVAGRWPANIVHDGSDEVLAAFPQTTSGTGAVRKTARGMFGLGGDGQANTEYGDSGSAARFFYAAKASRKDRDEGLEHMAAKPGGSMEANVGKVMGLGGASLAGEHKERQHTKNTHPTVKPTALMQWLCRLVTPPGGVILDPFMGSGSTGKAALLEGFKFIGCEREDEYMPIAQARIAAALRRETQPATNDNQASLFDEVA